MIAEIKQHKLNFKFEAGTSRGVMTSKDSWFVKLYDEKTPDIFGIGECGPLSGLSPDLEGGLENEIQNSIGKVGAFKDAQQLDVDSILSGNFPALRFAFETAKMDLLNGGRRMIVDNAFSQGQQEISINGLVWMGEKELMLQRVKDKLEAGFDCIKIKIGAIYLEEEMELLKFIRSRYSANEIEIRLDANGAFHESEVQGILDRLAEFDIHSIEQPIKAGNWEAMKRICKESPIPIALDEELIGIKTREQKVELLEAICPQYIILKPTLVGGLDQSRQWIELAKQRGIDWWITSALESNIGLNAIAQFVSQYDLRLPQGLGTGQLFHNNIPSPLYIRQGKLGYGHEANWDLAAIF